MATRRRLTIGLLIILGLGGWNANPAHDPDIAENWYPLACRVWASQLQERVADLHMTGRLDPADATLFEAAIRRRAVGCPASGFDTLRLLISLGEALREWPAPGKGM